MILYQKINDISNVWVNHTKDRLALLLARC
jgi:hypothetical protein